MDYLNTVDALRALRLYQSRSQYQRLDSEAVELESNERRAQISDEIIRRHKTIAFKICFVIHLIAVLILIPLVGSQTYVYKTLYVSVTPEKVPDVSVILTDPSGNPAPHPSPFDKDGFITSERPRSIRFSVIDAHFVSYYIFNCTCALTIQNDPLPAIIAECALVPQITSKEDDLIAQLSQVSHFVSDDALYIFVPNELSETEFRRSLRECELVSDE